MSFEMGDITACVYANGRDQADERNLIWERGQLQEQICREPPVEGLTSIDRTGDSSSESGQGRQCLWAEAGPGLGATQGRQRLLTRCTPTRRPGF